MSGAFRHLGDSTVHVGHVWQVATAEFETPDGERFVRDVVRSPGAVGVLPVVFDAEGSPAVVLVEQYRPPYDALVIEIPAGMRDVDGEDTETVARRELAEEAGLVADEVELLGEILPSPGMTDSITTLYLASGCRPVATDRQGPEERFMALLHVPFERAIDMVVDGRIRDAKSVAALFLAERRLRAADGSPVA